MISIWATGEARSRAKMAGAAEMFFGRCTEERLKETAGRITVDEVDDGRVELEIKEKAKSLGCWAVDSQHVEATLSSVTACLYSNLTLKSKLSIGGKQAALPGLYRRLPQVLSASKLIAVDGKKINQKEEATGDVPPQNASPEPFTSLLPLVHSPKISLLRLQELANYSVPCQLRFRLPSEKRLRVTAHAENEPGT